MATGRWLLIYGLLLGGSIIFSLPFVWMIGTSFKVDREMFGEEITFLPMRPVARPRLALSRCRTISRSAAGTLRGRRARSLKRNC
jgi:ABC-type glycerol-3-phosphate transport system permease component